jgi:hypothetical protein
MPAAELEKFAPKFERASLREAEIKEGLSSTGETQRRVRCTMIAVGPGNITDKCFYTQEAINAGPAFFEGARCFANHPSAFDRQVQPERRIEQEIGYWTDVTVEGEKLAGTLNILDGPEQDKYWNRIKGAIAYAKKYPGRNIFGVSIHASGDYKPMQYQGETWKQVFRFADAKSCDFVTWPARNGEFTSILSESEKEELNQIFGENLTESEVDPDVAKIFQTLKDQVGALSKAGAPGSEEVRRIVDQLGTRLKLNKLEERMDPITQQPASAPDPTADVSDEALATEARQAGHKACAEAYRRQAETETEAGKKGHAMKMAERHTKASEAFVHAAPGANVNVKPAAPAAPGAPKPPAVAGESEEEAEARRQAEARQAEDEAKRQAESKQAGTFQPASESEFRAKYNGLLIDNLLLKSGLSKGKENFLRTVILEGEKDENRIRGKIAAYLRAELQESDRTPGHGGPRNDYTGNDSGNELKISRPGLSRLLAKG